MISKINGLRFFLLSGIVLSLLSFSFIQNSYALVPTVVSAKITAANTITIVYSEPVTTIAAQYTALALTAGGSRSVSSISGSGSATILITFSGAAAAADETGTIDIAGTVASVANPLDLLVAITGKAITDGQAPLAPSIPTSSGGIEIDCSEKTSGFQVTASLSGSNAVAGDTLVLLLGGSSFPGQTRILNAGDIAAGQYVFTISSGQLGSAGAKSITSRVTDIAVNVGSESSQLLLTLVGSCPATSPDADVTDMITADFYSLIPTFSFPQINSLTNEQADLDSKINTQYVKVGKPFDFSIQFPVDQSMYLQKAQLYLNLRGIEHEVHESDTYIQYDKFNPLVIEDPHDYFSNADVKVENVNGFLNYKFTIIFSKTMEKSNLIFQYIDEARNFKRIEFPEALQVEDDLMPPKPSQPSHVFENESGIVDTTALSRENLEEGITTINLNDETKRLSLISKPSILDDQSVQANTERHISSGIKKEANFWANGILSNQEFAKSIQYLKNEGFLTTSVKSIEPNLATISEVLKKNNIALDFTKTSDEKFISILDFLLDDGLINEDVLLENVATVDDIVQQIDSTLKATLKETLATEKEKQTEALNKWNENGKKIDGNLFQLINSPDPDAEAKRLGLMYKDGKAKVIVGISESKPELLHQLQTLGQIDFISDNYVQMSLDLNKLSDIVESNEVQKIRIPYAPIQNESPVSEVGSINADLVHLAGITGRGVKVAVIDFAFDLNNPKILPNIAYAKSFRYGIDDSTLPLTGLESERLHGTAVAELLVDTAPNSKLSLYTIGNDLEFAMALKDAIANKVDIITIPLGWANLPTDGTSYITNNVNAAVKAGIIVVVPSGNFAQNHWEGKYTDVNSNGWHEFTDNDEGLTFNITPDRIKKEIPLIINLLWDNENAAVTDFDMMLISPSNEVVSFSANVQKTQNDTTFEQIRYFPSEAGTYSVGILYDGSHKNPGIPIEIFSVNDELEHYVTDGSVIVPADADGIIVTGAVNVTSGEIEPFSSRGPTNNGHAVPHVLAPDGVSTIAYGDKLFYGTSAAAPYVAGIAALVLEIDPTISLEEILKDIKENTIPQSSDSSIYCDEIGQCGLIDAALIVPWEKIR